MTYDPEFHNKCRERIDRLNAENADLHGQLDAAQERVRELEAQVLLDTGNIERMRDAGERAEAALSGLVGFVQLVQHRYPDFPVDNHRVIEAMSVLNGVSSALLCEGRYPGDTVPLDAQQAGAEPFGYVLDLAGNAGEFRRTQTKQNDDWIPVYLSPPSLSAAIALAVEKCAKILHGRGDSAYCNAVQKSKNELCLGEEAKINGGSFTLENLKALEGVRALEGGAKALWETEKELRAQAPGMADEVHGVMEDGERYKARRHAVYLTRIRCQISLPKPSEDEFNAEYDAGCDKERDGYIVDHRGVYVKAAIDKARGKG